ncbi:MAG: cell division protein FtsZ [Chloroherpetonaceae bacterium]|nr:cell division protein FtsZ [Chloroherpetonaceae bacterium]
MTSTFEFDRAAEHLGGAKIKIIGVGGCGGNAVNNMIERGITGVEFIVCNTDRQALSASKADETIQLGREATKGLGAGFNPLVGQKAAEEDRERISELVRNTDMLFITAGMGKGTGTGAAPVVAAIAKNLGILTIGIITKPFNYEGPRVTQTAEKGIEELRKHVDTLIVVQNQRILQLAPKGLKSRDAYNLANEVLYRAAKGISEIVTNHGHVNVDFADVRNIMTEAGDAVMGSAVASGEERALRAAKEAISSPLLDGQSIKGSSGVLVNITGDVSIDDVEIAMNYIQEQVGTDAHIIHGIVENEEKQGEITVTVIATGFNKKGVNFVRNISAATQQPIATPSGLKVVRSSGLQEPIKSPIQAKNVDPDQTQIFGSNSVGVPKAPETHLPKPFDVNDQRPFPTGRPQISEPQNMRDIYEIPAYMRKENQQPIQPIIKEKPPLDEEITEKPVTDLKSFNDERIRKNNPDRPAFLRRIMD